MNTDDSPKKAQTGTQAGSQPLQQDPGKAEENGLTDITTDLKRAQQEIAALTETSKRALADLQNYRKRVEGEKEEFSKFANLALILDLLPIVDNFARAFAHASEEMKSTEWYKGMKQIEQQLLGVLNKFGCVPIEDPTGKNLDPRQHQAIMTGAGKKDTVLEVFERGYRLGEKIIRPAKVKVGDGKNT